MFTIDICRGIYFKVIGILITSSFVVTTSQAKENTNTRSSTTVISNDKCAFPNVTKETASTLGPPWSEQKVIVGLRVWHLICLILIGLLILVTALCCFMKCRVPRTKEEIEENHRRNKMVKRFRKHLRNLRVEEEMDLITVIHEVARIHQDSKSISSKMSTLDDKLSYDRANIENFESIRVQEDSTHRPSTLPNILDDENKLINNL